MFNKWQLVLLGVVVFQGAALNAMDKITNASQKVSLDRSQEIKIKSEAIVAAVKRSAENRKVKENGDYHIPGFILAAGLNWPEELKRNPDLAWLPI
jgi:hypothetical protein